MEFRILGPLEVVDEHGPVGLGTVKERVVLAVLLLHANEVVSRERLIDELWGDSPPPTARKAVNVYVSQLRKVLARNGADPIETVAGGYRLAAEDGALDASTVQQLLELASQRSAAGEPDAAVELLRRALAVWRGRTLAGLELESVGRHEIEQWDELRMAALMDRIDCDLALGRHEQLIGELNRLVAEHPLRERLRAQQMLALYRAGRQADALEAYQQARKALVDELGIEPSSALQRLQKGILGHDPALEIPTGTGVRARVAAEEAEPSVAPPVAGRRRRPRGRLVLAGGLLALALAGGVTAFATRARGHARLRPPVPVSENSLLRLDVSTGRVVDAAPAGVEPAAMAPTRSSLWVVSRGDGLVSRRAWDGGEAQPVGLPDPYDIAADATGGAWVTERKPVVTWIDRVPSGSGTSAVAVAKGDVSLPGPAAGAVAVGGGYVWVIPGPLASGAGSDRVSLVSVTNRRFVSSLPLGHETTAIAYGYGAAWIGTYDARTSSSWVSVLRPRSPRVAWIRVGSGDGWGPLAIAAGDGSIWALTSAGTLVQIDPELGRVVNQIPLANDEPEYLAVGAGAVWVVNGSDFSVSKIDPTTGTRIHRVQLGSYARVLCGITATRDSVWVTVGDSWCDPTNR